HLHKDHAGGVSENENHSQLSFPNAKYYVQERELNFAFEKGFPSFIIKDLASIKKNSGQVILLKDDKGVIDDYIHYNVTAAHSPYHQLFLIKDNNETIFFGGDDAPQLQQMKHRFIAKYDFDGRKAMKLRSEWIEKGSKENWAFLFYHDFKTPIWNFS
ncbi:MAG: MBL fold metallo-hydrolase, partial [Bacteroidia bacterium]|nr:MBL fold metallo-hydrolase [Bacteroidia bacterium]